MTFTKLSVVFVGACLCQGLIFLVFSTFTLHRQDQGENAALPRMLSSSYSPPSSADAIREVPDPDALNCKAYLQDYRDKKLNEMERKKGWEKSFVTRTSTPKPFYWSLHSPALDVARATSYEKGAYYESQLSKRIMEAFDGKTQTNSDSIFLDVGGNIGWFSLLAAAHGASKVYTFEPNPANLVRICESISLNHWLRYDDRSKDTVIPIPKGLSNMPSKQKLYRANEHNPGSYTFSREIAARGHQARTREETTRYLETEGVVGEIEILTLDDFARSHGWFESKPSIGFFKLDVEGFEPFVIDGAKELFRSRIVELFAMEMKPLHKSQAKSEMLDVIFNAGYELYMHGAYKGPHKIVTEKYSNLKDLVDDIVANKFKENLLFRRRDNWENAEMLRADSRI
jgi:FkbM family methyltransferase